MNWLLVVAAMLGVACLTATIVVSVLLRPDNVNAKAIFAFVTFPIIIGWALDCLLWLGVAVCWLMRMCR
mgnify:CR=1 FL=1